MFIVYFNTLKFMNGLKDGISPFFINTFSKCTCLLVNQALFFSMN